MLALNKGRKTSLAADAKDGFCFWISHKDLDKVLSHEIVITCQFEVFELSTYQEITFHVSKRIVGITLCHSAEGVFLKSQILQHSTVILINGLSFFIFYGTGISVKHGKM